MEILRSISDCRAWRRNDRRAEPVGFVPTMGSLHAGHMALVRAARARCRRSVVSIFVNPTQFDDPKDLAQYPIAAEADRLALEQAGVDALFVPSAEEIYPDRYRFRVSESEDSRVLCGAHRPGHFDGVLTVVMKLFHIIEPDQAFFGEKDFQQLQLIGDMVKAFHLPLAVVAVPTVREPDGLAMSSRNQRLGPEARSAAPLIHQLLKSDLDCRDIRRALEGAGFEVDYVEQRWGRRLAAARIDGVRLIDNVAL